MIEVKNVSKSFKDVAVLKNVSTVFEEGDIVWIVGEHEKVVQLSEGKTVNN